MVSVPGRKKEFELAGRAVLAQGKKIIAPPETGLAIEGAVVDFLEFIKNKKRPNTLKRVLSNNSSGATVQRFA